MRDRRGDGLIYLALAFLSYTQLFRHNNIIIRTPLSHMQLAHNHVHMIKCIYHSFHNQRKDQFVSLTLCFTTQQVDRQREYSLWRSTCWVVKHSVRDIHWSFRWLWRLSSVSITEDWALFVRRTFIFMYITVSLISTEKGLCCQKTFLTNSFVRLLDWLVGKRRRELIVIQNISYASYFRLFSTRRLPYENKMHAKDTKQVIESVAVGAVSDCTKISCIRSESPGYENWVGTKYFGLAVDPKSNVYQPPVGPESPKSLEQPPSHKTNKESSSGRVPDNAKSWTPANRSNTHIYSSST